MLPSPSAIAERLIRSNDVCIMCNGTVHIYVGAIGGWTPMDSGLANRYIRATVDYAR